METINWFAWVHLQSLIMFRDSVHTMDAGNCWLDKEISDLKKDLGIQEVEQYANTSGVTATHQTPSADAIGLSRNSKLV